jgi:TrpR-related protein YerC/YecD
MLEKELQTKEIKELFKAILKLENVNECEKFFRDLCTLSELLAMSERLQVAKRVYKGETYRDVCNKTGASTATITRVAHWLNYGMGGYKLILGKLHR